MKLLASELALIVGGSLESGGSELITGVAQVDKASDSDVVVASNQDYFNKAAKSRACCVIVGPKCDGNLDGKAIIRVNDIVDAQRKLLEYAKGPDPLPPVGIDGGCYIGKVRLGQDVRIGRGCIIGDGSSLGDGCVIYPGVNIGENVKIGSDTKIYSNVVIYRNCVIGSRCLIHAGAAIGADGFGYEESDCGRVKLPHAGRVVIGDDVEIGANAAIDRAKTGDTLIGNRTKIDNLVHIAHNVRIGENCVVVAMSGIAGSSEIEDGVILAAQTGVKDHVKIGAGSIVLARAGVVRDIAAGSVVYGFPARDHGDEKRTQAVLHRLPDLLERVRSLEKQVNELRGRSGL